MLQVSLIHQCFLSWYTEVGILPVICYYALIELSCLYCIKSESHFQGDFFWIFMHFIQHCYICRLSDFTVSEDVRIEPRTIGTGHWQSGALTTQLYLIQKVKVI
jgi:hypothetical protein